MMVEDVIIIKQSSDCEDLWKLNRANKLKTSNFFMSKFLSRLNFLLRVWSWLRTNAGGVLNTCKSSDETSSEVD